MQFNQKYGPAVLIAGAAEGLGEAWSKAMSQRGMKLVMVDNQEEKLNALASKLRQEYHIEAVSLVQDLADDNAAELIMEAGFKAGK